MLLLPVTVGGSGFYQPALRVPVQAVAVYGAPRALPSYAYAGLKIGCMNIIDILYSYFGLVLGCIDADLCKYILIFSHFSRSTRCAFFCTAPISKFQQKFVKRFLQIFGIFHQNLRVFVIFSLNFDEISPDFLRFLQKLS